ncbi:MAG: FtsH protease activity modulator HflK, partial [Tistlia sp.]
GFGGSKPPDLDDVIRKGQDRLKQLLPGGGFNGRGLMIGIAVVLVIWMLSGFYRVNPGEQGVVLRFGQWVNQENLAQPGLHWHLPWPIETAITPQVDEVRQIDVGYVVRGGNTRNTGTVSDLPRESLMLTGDQNIIDIDFSVQWRIFNAGQFLFNIRDPELTVKLAAESAMREIVGRTDILPLIATEKEAVAQRTRETLQRILDEYQAGVTITAINMQNVQPPQPVADAFEEVQRARQDLDTKRNQADAYRNRVIPEARGQARRTIEESQAYKQRVVAEASGEADRFSSVYEAYRLAPDVTRKRLYLETMQNVLGNANKVIFDLGDGGNGTQPIVPFDRLLAPESNGASGGQQ